MHTGTLTCILLVLVADLGCSVRRTLLDGRLTTGEALLLFAPDPKPKDLLHPLNTVICN